MGIKKIMEELEISISDEDVDILFIKKLNRNKDKVKNLRFVKHYSQEKTAKMIGISKRHVQRIEKQLKNVV